MNNELPQHIAIIMDGNRRWAKNKRLPVIMGHQAGVKAFRRTVEAARELGIKILTVYAFSCENWNRPNHEVSILLHLFEYYTQKERENLKKNGIKFQTIGEIDKLPLKLQKELKKTEEYTKENKNLILNLAINYSGREEILRAIRLLFKDFNGKNLDSLNNEVFANYLYTAKIPDPDLLIRTSGEIRISNFLLWQLAYSELWFSSKLWPEFNKEELILAIQEYQKRDRRFGSGGN
ncbi:MAG: isoprenyl transferase [Armatimonadetes bacterium]|nr:isoprenyl transferase [Armatimonadota bacterium]